jgi:hypothetical protein
MRFNDLILIESDTELECFRLDLLDAISCNTQRIKSEAEKVLGVKVRGIRPLGDIMDVVKFTEESDIEIAIYIDSISEYDKESSIKAQAHFDQLTLSDLGVIVPHVYRKH